MTLFFDDEVADTADAAAVELFAGPGGWSEALRSVGVRSVGIEMERFACSTRRLAGHPTIESDVTSVDPAWFPSARGLVASPPCQALSSAGGKHGRKHVDTLCAAIASSDWSFRPHHDPNVWLALEVGRWWDALLPEWVALEQVPAALPLWEAYAELMHGAGWSTWTGVLDAADYGVPQHRRRAVLIAHANIAMHRPPPVDGPHVSMTSALGIEISPYLVATGRNWNRGNGTSQVVDCAAGPAPTLTAISGSQWHMNVDADRPRSTPTASRLSVRDALAIQSFRPDYPMAGTMSSQFAQIGNAVPPALGRHVLGALGLGRPA